MSKKKDIWNQVTLNLKSKLSKSDYNTWFSQTTLKKLDADSAVIGVPNKFVSNWLYEKYLVDITKSFKKVLKHTPPNIYFTYDQASSHQNPVISETVETSNSYRHHVNPSMTFDRFIVGSGNKFANSSAQEVSKGDATDYNPLYIYSPLAVGKTHLLHAIGNDVLKSDPLAYIRYLSSETFTSDFTFSIKNKKIQEFREKYCNLDLLLFDDVQLLENRKKTQEEFLFIFKALYESKHRVVIAGQRPPNELKNLNSQLKSRLGSGLLIKIKIPDQKTKIDIIKNKAKEDDFNLPDDVIFFLATSSNDIKVLIKNLVRIKTFASLNRGNINISLVKSIIKERRQADLSVDDIKTIVAGYFNISVPDLISKKKKRSCAYPRQIAMYLSRKYTDLSYKGIGTSFGQKDHSTVIYAVRRIEKCKDQDENISNDIQKVENLMG